MIIQYPCRAEKQIMKAPTSLVGNLLPWPLAQAVNQNSNRQIGEGITLNHPGSLNRLFGRCTTHRVNISALTPRSANTWGGLLPGARIKVRDMKSFRTLGPFHETSTLKVHSGSPRSSPQHEVGQSVKRTDSYSMRSSVGKQLADSEFRASPLAL
ncbi:hypothetical protein BJV77DRAFT_1012681 [Russula vinacea]|nr:hypothetical protein BJV77DRAFT_1012681 [Russula vinacea]